MLLRLCVPAVLFSQRTAGRASSRSGLICSLASVALLCACGGGGSSDTNSAPGTATASGGYTVGGNISGLNVQGLVLSNGPDTITVPAGAASFTFPTRLPSGAAYSVSIASQPPRFTQACALSSAAGIVGNGNVQDVAISCRNVSAVVTTLAASDFFVRVPSATATFFRPQGVAVDASGNVFVADSRMNRIRKVTQEGVVTTFAGSFTEGSADGIGTEAGFRWPTSVAIDNAGNVFVADGGNDLIRKITPSGAVTTIAGNGTRGSTNGIGTEASFNSPQGIALDDSGNLYVADAGSEMIRKITPAGVVTTLAGNGSIGPTDGIGTAARFNNPYGVAVDASGNVYVADLQNNKIRKISSSGVVTTLAGNGNAGSDDGIAATATFRNPQGVAVDRAGNLFIADGGNNKIRVISPAGFVATVAGNGTSGRTDGIGSAASFDEPYGVAVDNAGNVYVSDSRGNAIRKISEQ